MAALGVTPRPASGQGDEKPHDRVLSPFELAALNDALIDLGAEQLFPVAAIQMAALTGLRIGEVLSLK